MHTFPFKAKQHLKAERLEEELAEGKKPEVMVNIVALMLFL